MLALGLRNVLAAADAAFLLVTSVLLRCVSAEPAADFAALLALGFRKVRAAADAALLPVDSRFPPFAISLFLLFVLGVIHLKFRLTPDSGCVRKLYAFSYDVNIVSVRQKTPISGEFPA